MFRPLLSSPIVFKTWEEWSGCFGQDDSSASENVTNDCFMVIVCVLQCWLNWFPFRSPEAPFYGGMMLVDSNRFHLGWNFKVFHPTSRRQFLDVLWGFLRDINICVATNTTWVPTGEATSWQREWILTSWPRNFLKTDQEYVRDVITWIC